MKCAFSHAFQAEELSGTSGTEKLCKCAPRCLSRYISSRNSHEKIRSPLHPSTIDRSASNPRLA